MNKAEWRKAISAQRAQVTPQMRLRASEDAARLALSLLEAKPAPIALYWPVRNELSPLILSEHLHARHLPLCLPVVIEPDQPLRFRSWQPGNPMHKGRYGIDEPPHSAPFVVPQTLLLPLISFDRTGNRLGTGGGYYDRTLAMLRATDEALAVLGFAYAFQESPVLPHEAHDQKLDGVITEKEVVLF